MSLNLPVADLVLTRGWRGLGFLIRGGTDCPHVSSDTGIFVSCVLPGGAACRDGRLKEGDKILAVNDKSVEGLTHEEALEIFVTAGNTVNMKVQHGAYLELMNLKIRRGSYPVDVDPKVHGGGNVDKGHVVIGSFGEAIIALVLIAAVAGGGWFVMKEGKFKK